MSLKIHTKEYREGVYTAMPEGSLDADTNFSFEEKLKPVLSVPARVLILDMGKLKYIDSMGLATVLKIRKAIEEDGGELVIANLSPRLKNIFEVITVLPEKYIFENMQQVNVFLDTI